MYIVYNNANNDVCARLERETVSSMLIAAAATRMQHFAPQNYIHEGKLLKTGSG